MTQTYEVPADWLTGAASRKPLQLVNAFAFATSSTPPPDQWTYFAKLRPVPWRPVAGCAAIALVCVWGFFGTLELAGDEVVYTLIPLAGLLVGGLYFGWIAIMSVLSYSKRTGWPHLHGAGIGESGIAFRFAGGDADVPWDSVTSIRAVFTNADDPRKPHIPVLRVEFDGSTVDLNTGILGANPRLLYSALTYYWKNPESRSELGTSLAQKRMEGWLPVG
ncbi:hypothetical protein C3B61_13990 [Cryobacterium zongtaii]|uniref:Uncharacterized protein n=1 Tax=Cryobacterium zongtaii TaxID=1259217 RepID=A0A2S3ZCB2_9MICO|nr:hypothetical protein [Cryobacterium zongtaii]POH63894.1 hypothetical protein C3B61_13990 [Cryobacterium zongtaii]